MVIYLLLSSFTFSAAFSILSYSYILLILFSLFLFQFFQILLCFVLPTGFSLVNYIFLICAFSYVIPIFSAFNVLHFFCWIFSNNFYPFLLKFFLLLLFLFFYDYCAFCYICWLFSDLVPIFFLFWWLDSLATFSLPKINLFLISNRRLLTNALLIWLIFSCIFYYSVLSLAFPLPKFSLFLSFLFNYVPWHWL